MQALAEFSAAVYGGKVDMTVDVAVPGLTHKFNVNSDNSLVLQRVEVNEMLTLKYDYTCFLSQFRRTGAAK